MPLTKNTLLKVSLSVFVLLGLFSCSKDADLLSEYVITQEEDIQSITLLADDSFFMAPGQNTILMDVLNNDNFGQNSNATIVETSVPINGSVTINEDNTLTYIAQVEESVEETSTTEETSTEPEEDTFTYTAEVVDEETGETTKEEATVTVTATPTNSDMGELKAFPGAEGFGMYTKGGRGGKVIHVTNLNDSGSGSLREAIETSGARTIVFDVGGEINLTEELSIGSSKSSTNIEQEYVTIAGETAPYPGITIRGAGIGIFAKEVIIRYITVRVNDNLGNDTDYDAMRIINWDNSNYNLKNIIIDHVSLSNSDDENFSCHGASDFTFQNSMITDSNNSYSFLFGQNNFNFSFVGNYISHTAERNVLVGYGTNGETSEYINNIIYGYEGGMFITHGNYTDVLGNIYKAFKDNTPNYASIEWKANVYNNPNGLITNGGFYLADNFQLNDHNYELYNTDALAYKKENRIISNTLISTWETTISGIESRVFGLKDPGNSLFQDTKDSQAIKDYFDNTGNFNSLPIPSKSKTSRPSNYDSDNDGMADEWEIAVFGDLTKSANGDENGNGYTNIEEFLYWLKL